MRFFIIISVFLFLPKYFVAQDVHQTFELGVESYERGDYSQALPLFRRVLFFGKDQYRFDTYRMIASSYKELAKYEPAHKFLDLAYRNCNNDSVQKEIVFEKAVLFVLEEKFNYALIELYNVETNSLYFTTKYEFYMGVINFKQGDYEGAHQNFKNCIAQDTSVMNELYSLFEENHEVNKLNPKRAQYLSYVLPGLGQLYAGDYENAINSLLINAAFLTLYFEVAFSYSLLDGMLSILPWFNRYYLGGATKAKEIANKKIVERRNEVFAEILHLIAEQKTSYKDDGHSSSTGAYE